MRYYTDGYEYASECREDFDCPDEELYTIDLDHKEGDTYLTVLEEGYGFTKVTYSRGASLAKALEAWACNCDCIYQIRDGVAIYSFSTTEGNWNMNKTLESILEELRSINAEEEVND